MKEYVDFFIVVNEKGLHTRPSTELVKCARKFTSEITFTYQNQEVDGKSLLGLLMLGATRGSKVKVKAIGEDAEEAVKALLALALNKCNVIY